MGIFQVDPETDNTSPQRAETEILSNYIFVDEKSGMDVQRDVWQEKTEYANGITFWIEDPALLTGALEKLQSIPGYDWDSYFINTNNADYDRAAGPLTQMEKIPVSYTHLGKCEREEKNIFILIPEKEQSSFIWNFVFPYLFYAGVSVGVSDCKE